MCSVYIYIVYAYERMLPCQKMGTTRKKKETGGVLPHIRPIKYYMCMHAKIFFACATKRKRRLYIQYNILHIQRERERVFRIGKENQNWNEKNPSADSSITVKHMSVFFFSLSL